MSLSARFEQAHHSGRSGAQKGSSSSRVVVQASQPPRGPKGGVKKVTQQAKSPNKNQKSPNSGKNAKGQKKAPNKNVKPKKKTLEELNAEIDAYTMGKEAALAAKLDADMDDYHASRAAAATVASSAPES